jgi:hypothetical protein
MNYILIKEETRESPVLLFARIKYNPGGRWRISRQSDASDLVITVPVME